MPDVAKTTRVFTRLVEHAAQEPGSSYAWSYNFVDLRGVVEGGACICAPCSRSLVDGVDVRAVQTKECCDVLTNFLSDRESARRWVDGHGRRAQVCAGTHDRHRASPTNCRSARLGARFSWLGWVDVIRLLEPCDGCSIRAREGLDSLPFANETRRRGRRRDRKRRRRLLNENYFIFIVVLITCGGSRCRVTWGLEGKGRQKPARGSAKDVARELVCERRRRWRDERTLCELGEHEGGFWLLCP
jgi:hypothetical protein